MVLPRDDEARGESDEELRALVRLLGGSAPASMAARETEPAEPLPARASAAHELAGEPESSERDFLAHAPATRPSPAAPPVLAPVRTHGLALAALALTGLFALLAWRARASLARERATNAAQVLAAEGARHDERARAALERFLGLLEEGELAAAGELLAAAQDDPALAQRGYDTRFLVAALATRRALDAPVETEFFARAERELEARDALASAQARREPFLLAAHPWLAQPGVTRVAPRAELLRWFENLEQELARRSDALARSARRGLTGALEARAASVCARLFPELAPELARALRDSEPARAELLARIGAGEALAGIPGELRLWRVRRADGSLAWRAETFARSAGGELTLERRSYDARGQAGGVERGLLVWRGTRLEFEGLSEEALEFAQEVAEEPWPASDGGAPPPELLPPGASVLAPRDAPLLVLGRAPRRSWFAAELGLARRELADGTLLELVARARP